MAAIHRLVALVWLTVLASSPLAHAFLCHPSCHPLQYGCNTPSSSSSSSLPQLIHYNGKGATTFALFAKKKKKKKKSPGDNTITVNRVAYRNYEILDTIEAGISLQGTEVKAIRDGKMNLKDGYVRPSKNGRSCVLYNAHIGKHNMAGAYFQHEEKRPRTLLVHKEQARKWKAQTDQAGMTIVPLKAYFTEANLVKIQIALCRGKNVRDKRATIKERDAKREASRILKSFRV